MRQEPPSLSNARADRFLFGAFALAEDTVLFRGTVVTGRGFVYDPVTGLPVGGVVTSVQLQTRSETEIKDIHATVDHPDLDVALLNHVYEDSPTDWFDPVKAFRLPPVPAPPAKASVIHLETGDTLTEEDMTEIFGVQTARIQRLTRKMTPADADFWDIDPECRSSAQARA